MELHKAVIAGDYKAARSLLWAGADPNIRTPEGLMILQHENAWKYPWIASALIRRGADMGDLSAEGFSGVYYAIKYLTKRPRRTPFPIGKPYATQVLAGGNTLMHLVAGGAIFKDKIEFAMNVLHRGGVDFHARNDEGLTALEIAEGVRNRACIEFLQEHARWEFTDAVSRDNITKVKKMIADGVDVDYGEPAFLWAFIPCPGTEMMELLRDHQSHTKNGILQGPHSLHAPSKRVRRPSPGPTASLDRLDQPHVADEGVPQARSASTQI